MREDIRTEVLASIRRDYHFAEPRGEWLQKGKCPNCGRKELFTSVRKPWVLRCSRQNRCGWEGEVRDLYPEIFDNWSNRHEATEANPHAAADAYLLHARGLDLRLLRGAYTQESYFDRDKNIASATVRFDLPGGSWWERLIDQPGRFDRKARFAPGKSYSGQVWIPRDVTLDQLSGAKEIWIAEGIFDCSALWQAFSGSELAEKGLFAVSAMSVSNWPEKFLDELRKAIANGPAPTHQPRLIFAFDVGKAGADYSRKYVKRARDEGWEASAAQPRPEGEDDKLDWNNLLVRDRLTEKHLAEYRANGEVLVATDAFEKAFKLWQQKGGNVGQFPFIFNSETYWAEFSHRKIDEVVKELQENPAYEGKDPREVRQEAAEQVGTIKRICTAAFRTLYFQRNPATEESHYYIRIDFPTDRHEVKAPFSGGALSASAEFKKRLISVAPGALWLGSGEQLDRIVGTQTRRIKTVETLDFTGYDRKREVYVLGDYAVRRGRVFRLNDEDFFDFGDCALKLATTERLLEIEYDAEARPVSWFPVLIEAFGMNGLVTCAYWIMSLFAEQIRASTKSLAFLEMSGLPGTGKSTVLEFLWKTAGRENYEGFDPTKGTAAAIARNLGKVSNLPVVLIEGDRNEAVHHSKKFEWEELKSLYNGRATRSRGVKNGGMETFEPLFRGSIIIAQNDPVSASPAVLERIMSLHFDKSGFSEATRAAAERLERWPAEELSGFILFALRHEEQFMKAWADAYARYQGELQAASGVNNIRLLRNHAQLAAALTAMRQFLPVSDGLHAAGLKFIAEMTAARQRVVSSEHPVVEKFWQIFDYLVEIETESQREERPLNNHRKADEYIAVSLPQFFERCRAHGQVPPTEDDLRRHLKTSKGRKFVACKPVNAPGGKHFYCWVFTRPLSETAII
ncbi:MULTISPECIES: toprim domain-containing protein [Novosphingobium]|uniref:toprim domain-containing protein n=1 Tax=Novosphingobium TaxID=165696 RepID=UPI001374B33E|nr:MULTISPECIES: toprim domain-containing protein [Novosphingobium]